MESTKADIWALIANGYVALRYAYREIGFAGLRASVGSPNGEKFAQAPKIHEQQHLDEFTEAYQADFDMALDALCSNADLAGTMVDAVIADFVAQYERTNMTDRIMFRLISQPIFYIAKLGASQPAFEKLLAVFEALEVDECRELREFLNNVN